MDNNENSFNSQQNTSAGEPNNYYQSGGQNYYQSSQTSAQDNGQTYGQTGQNNQAGSQPEQNAYAYGQTYSQPEQNANAYGQNYGQQNQYGQTYQNTNTYGQNYSQPNGYQMNGTGAPLVDANGNPLKNNFAMKMTFSILEMLCCNLISLIMGIIGCIFSAKANTSYKEGRADDFKSQAKTATICLWVGFASIILSIIVSIVIFAVTGASLFDDSSSSVNSGNSGSSFVSGGMTSVTVDGYEIGIPLDFSDLEDMGFELDSYYEDTEIAAYDIDFVAVTNAYGDNVMWAWVENENSYTVDPTECTVIGIDVDYNCDNYESFSTPDGITFFCDKDDLVDLLGEADEFDVDYDGRELWRWYLSGQESSWQVIEITFDEDDYIFDIDIDYRM